MAVIFAFQLWLRENGPSKSNSVISVSFCVQICSVKRLGTATGAQLNKAKVAQDGCSVSCSVEGVDGLEFTRDIVLLFGESESRRGSAALFDRNFWLFDRAFTRTTTVANSNSRIVPRASVLIFRVIIHAQSWYCRSLVIGAILFTSVGPEPPY